MTKKSNYPCTMPQRLATRGIRLAAFFILALLLAALAAAADDYSLEYSAIGLDGAQSQTTNYEVIGLLTADGLDSEPQSSGDYSVATTTGLKDEAGTRVDDWMLY